MKNKAVIFMMSMVLAMGSAVPAHADTEISENKDKECLSMRLAG